MGLCACVRALCQRGTGFTFCKLHYWAENSPRCIMCGDPIIRTWNGVYTMLRGTGKYLLARFDDGSRDPCKFQIRCVVSDEFKDDSDTAPLYVDWCGIAVHQHSSSSPDESRSIMTTLKLTKCHIFYI